MIIQPKNADPNANSLSFLTKGKRSTALKTKNDSRDALRRNTRNNSIASEESTISLNTQLARSSSPPPIPLVRKKSGELLKSSLSQRSRSLPGTPLPSCTDLRRTKSVHFDDEDFVKEFHMDDKPRAISGSGSPVQELEPKPQRNKPRRSKKFRERQKLAMKVLNFEPLTYALLLRSSQHVFLEQLAFESGTLQVNVAVQNIAFDKQVALRFSVDEWETFTDVQCVYAVDQPAVLSKVNYERFACSVKPQLGVVQFCFRLKTDKGEWWDNNCGGNYKIEVYDEESESGTSHSKSGGAQSESGTSNSNLATLKGTHTVPDARDFARKIMQDHVRDDPLPQLYPVPGLRNIEKFLHEDDVDYFTFSGPTHRSASPRQFGFAVFDSYTSPTPIHASPELVPAPNTETSPFKPDFNLSALTSVLAGVDLSQPLEQDELSDREMSYSPTAPPIVPFVDEKEDDYRKRILTQFCFGGV